MAVLPTGWGCCSIAWWAAAERRRLGLRTAPDAVRQAKPGGPHVDERAGSVGKPGRVVRCHEHRVTFHNHPEPEWCQPLERDLIQRPRAEPVRACPDSQSLVLDLDVDSKTLGRVSLILDTSFEFGDDFPQLVSSYRAA